MESIHLRLRRFRKNKKLRIKDVASKIEVPASTYQSWENGHAIQGEPYLKLASALEVSLHAIFGIETKENERVLDLLNDLEKNVKEIKKTIVSLI